MGMPFKSSLCLLLLTHYLYTLLKFGPSIFPLGKTDRAGERKHYTIVLRDIWKIRETEESMQLLVNLTP